MLESLQEELTCSFCLGYFNDPVVAKCGHRYCRECVHITWEEGRVTNCPLCSEIIYPGSLRSNRRLKVLTKACKLPTPHLVQSKKSLTTCDQHGKEEILFCEDDQRPLCVPCLSTEHKEHSVLPLEKAADQCIEKLQATSMTLKQKLKEFQIKLDDEKSSELQYKEQNLIFREIVQCEYRNMLEFLTVKEWCHLQILDQEAQQSFQRFKDKQVSLCLEIDNLKMMMEDDVEKTPSTWNALREKKRICQLELESERGRETQCWLENQAMRQKLSFDFRKKDQALVVEEQCFLQRLDQDVRENVANFKNSQTSLCQLINNLQMVIAEAESNLEKPFVEMLLDGKVTLERSEELLLQDPGVASLTCNKLPMPAMTEMLMTFQRDLALDPQTTHPHLIVSDDLKSVKYVPVPEDRPQTYGFRKIVLATHSFTSGKHYWEVEVGGESAWEIGICKRANKRQIDKFAWILCIQTGFQFQNGVYIGSLHSIQESQPKKKFGIFLDYERRYITFYNATDRTLLCSLPNLDFHGLLSPCFSPVVKNEESAHGHLIICPMKKQ